MKYSLKEKIQNSIKKSVTLSNIKVFRYAVYDRRSQDADRHT